MKMKDKTNKNLIKTTKGFNTNTCMSFNDLETYLTLLSVKY